MLRKKKTNIISISKKTNKVKEDKIIAFATYTPLYGGSNFLGIIVDYIATTDVEVKYILPSYPRKLFTGKGLGKLIINLIQVIAHIMSGRKKTNVMLKCNDDLTTFYEEIGFVSPIDPNKDIFSNDIIAKHYKNIPNLDPYLHKFVLPQFWVINHKNKSFINHVLKNLDEVDFDSTEGQSISDNVHKIFQRNNYSTWVDMIHPTLSETGSIVIPIGKVCTEFFKESIPNGIDIIQGIYGKVVENLVWELVPQIDIIQNKNHHVCHINVICNLCCEELQHKIVVAQPVSTRNQDQ